MGLELGFELVVGRAAFERDKDRNRLTLDVVRPADSGGFGDVRMADEGRFDLNRAQSMAADFDHVVDATHDPVVAVLVLPGVIAGEVMPRQLRPVLLLVALVVAPNAAEHAGPRLADAEH